MTYQQFMIQIQRMVNTFGKNVYNDERVRLIWLAVKDYDIKWFTKLIEYFIGDCRQAPLLSDFREAVSRERERLWDEEKKRNAKEAKDFMASRFSDEETSMIIQGIIRRLTGQMSDQEYAGLQAMLDSVAKHDSKEKPKCSKCDDTGIVEQLEGKFEYRRLCECA